MTGWEHIADGILHYVQDDRVVYNAVCRVSPQGGSRRMTVVGGEEVLRVEVTGKRFFDFTQRQ